MSLSSAVQAGRAAAEQLMVDTYSIQQSTGKAYVDGDEVETWTELFTTPGYVKVLDGAYSTRQEVAGRTADEVHRYLHIPADSAAIPAGRVSAVPLALDSTSDQTLAGARMILAPAQPGSHTTARRIRVTEVVT